MSNLLRYFKLHKSPFHSLLLLLYVLFWLKALPALSLTVRCCPRQSPSCSFGFLSLTFNPADSVHLVSSNCSMNKLLLLLHSRCLSFSPLYTQCSASQEIAFWNKQDQDWEKMLSMRTRSQDVRCSGPSSFSGSTQKGRYTSKLADRQ